MAGKDIRQIARENVSDLRVFLNATLKGWDHESNVRQTKWAMRLDAGWLTVTVLYDDAWGEQDFILSYVHMDEGRVVVDAGQSYIVKVNVNSPRKMILDHLLYQLEWHSIELPAVTDEMLVYLHGRQADE